MHSETGFGFTVQIDSQKLLFMVKATFHSIIQVADLDNGMERVPWIV